MRNGAFDDREQSYGDEMSVLASHCSSFARRRDFSAFNMTDYRSCENCSHMTADSRCTLGKDRISYEGLQTHHFSI